MVGSNFRTRQSCNYTMEQGKAMPHCCDIWMCRLEGVPGSSIQSGYRPVLVISNDLNNTHSTLVNVMPITSKGNKRNLPVHVDLENYADYGLSVPSTVLREQVTVLPADRLERCVGNVFDGATRLKIKRAIEIQFPFSN